MTSQNSDGAIGTTLNDAPVDLTEMPLAELRQYRDGLREDEDRVSYWRRLVQFRLNLIATETACEQVSTADLVKSLQGAASGGRREQLLSVRAEEPLVALPGLDDLWTHAIDPADKEGTERLVAALEEAEQTLSAYRRALHTRLDAATAELVERYKVDPSLATQVSAL